MHEKKCVLLVVHKLRYVLCTYPEYVFCWNISQSVENYASCTNLVIWDNRS